MTVTMRSIMVALAGTLLAAPIDAGAVSMFSEAGANALAIQATVDLYRAALGEPNNANNAGPLGAGRREINWDGGGATDGTAPETPFVVFQNTRGGTFTTPGTGLTQAPVTGGLLSLDLINPTYDDLFAPFTANRLFAPVGSLLDPGLGRCRGGRGAGLRRGLLGRGRVGRDDHRIFRHQR